MANGGDWGGVKVDQAFDKFLLDIVGMETMDRFRNEDKADYLSLIIKKYNIGHITTVKRCRKRLYDCIISPRGEFWDNKTSLTLSLFIEMSVPSPLA
jgi:hypothetical protein